MEQLLVVHGQLVDNADEMFDVGSQLSEFGGVLGAELLEFDDLPTQADLGVRRLSAGCDLCVEVDDNLDASTPRTVRCAAKNFARHLLRRLNAAGGTRLNQSQVPRPLRELALSRMSPTPWTSSATRS
ncbi:hypothetical protein ACFV8E_07215 [Streptomyces sp. NPDC059849]|uniref:hypothetical protein n=1 Tax=Streptomyces sp. NPDC059849 TaxID=3346969 RepID=UPI00366537BA